MRLMVFQHIDCEHPGSLRRFLAQDKVEWHAVNLHRGEPIPPLADSDALWVMGGPMDVWEEDAYPWLAAEKAAIRRWVLDMNKPFLGLCLGHQLLADALGGTCGPQRPPEIGILDVQLNDAGKKDALFAGMAAQQKCLQWHSVCVEQAPGQATVLAHSDACQIQAMRVGHHAWSMQYHVEVEPDTVANWQQIPAYRDALTAALGPDGATAMEAAAAEQLPGLLDCAEKLYRNFMHAVQRQAGIVTTK